MAKQDVTKLPKWVQEKIRNLEEKCESDRLYYERKLRELAGTDDSNVFIRECLSDVMPLPKDTQVTFLLPNGGEIAVYHNDRGSLTIRKGYSRASLCVSPEASNSIVVS